MAKSYDQHCPIAMTLDLIGDRWTILIIRDLYFGRRRFNDLLASSPGMSTKILSERLKLLEQHGLVRREIYSQHPLRAEYHLTDKGVSLEPVLNAVAMWGGKNLVDPEDAPALFAKIESMRPPKRARYANREADAGASAS
jgi:DNA-binding HxlR family transcriptional regulator